MSAPDTHSGHGSGFNLSAWALRQSSLVIFMMIVVLLAGAWS